MISDDDIDDDDETFGGWNNTAFPDFFQKSLKQEKFVREEAIGHISLSNGMP